MKSADYVLFDRAISRGNYPSIEWLSKHIDVAFATQKLTEDEYMELVVRVMELQGGEE